MAYPCELVEQRARPTLVVRTRSAVERLPEVLGSAWGAVMACAGRAGAAPSEAPFVTYYGMDMLDLDLEIGFAFDRPLTGDGEVRAGEIPAGRAVQCLRVAPYDQVGAAYDAVAAWMAERGLEQPARRASSA